MFWKKKKQKRYEKFFQGLMISASPLLTSPESKTVAQLFIIGALDMDRQTNKLEWSDFKGALQNTLKDHQLTPKADIDVFLNILMDSVQKDQDLNHIVLQGADCMGKYWGGSDPNIFFSLSMEIMAIKNNDNLREKLRAFN